MGLAALSAPLQLAEDAPYLKGKIFAIAFIDGIWVQSARTERSLDEKHFAAECGSR